MVFVVAVAIVLAATADALTVHHAAQSPLRNKAAHIEEPKSKSTFQTFYDSHTSGRGIWKWNNALVAYQRHFGTLAGRSLSVAEVGVQSGGSLLMWKNVLGPQIKLYGLDINPACKQFKEPNVSITIGDQGDWKMWHVFHTKTNKAGLDILVDDGGHEAHQMLTTLQSSFHYIHTGGYVCIEDITNAHYLDTFFKPTAAFISQQASQSLIDSVHLYPMLLVVRKGGFAANSPQASDGALKFSGTQTKVDNLTAMWTAIMTVPPGSHIVVQNPAWDNLFHVDSLTNFFTGFVGLHDGTFKDTPKGCSTTTAVVCTNAIEPLNHLQSRVSGVHVYRNYAVIEIPAQAPTIAAVRRGKTWIEYSR